ncbi:T9SS type A sorting domain-containing protein [Hymenobacter metallicola]|uniref:T9SS type A sorting domain-containing protein n=1 Tax=Hymenobacter metallicola TaxID=2563114 RepID=A0A4Z0QHZ3_9BACT|nr:T9SS type A sorting domain-containing protein [Hymenobacter metallicola]TGE29106.1 T9SS type A sorting domain-containing protein [Hymenobacter metallicola]
MQHHYYWPFALGLLLSTGTIFTAQAQRFELDASFDSDGKVTTELTPPSSNDNLTKIYPQADGKIIALGRSRLGGWVTVRYNTDGSVDTSYGTNGVIGYDLATQRPGTTFTLNQLQLLPDGKLLAVGVSGSQGALLRFNADGTIDSGFGSNGLLVRPTATNETSSTFRTAQLQPDGKIVAVGTRYQRAVTGTRVYNYLLVKRYNSDGTPDMEYTTAFVISTFGYDDTDGYGLAIQPDGKLLVSARATLQQSASKLAFVRLLADGSPDNSFGTAGRLYTGLDCRLMSSQILLLPSGKFVVNMNGDFNGTFGRFLPSGALDTSFGVNGVATFQHDNASRYDGPYHVAGGYNNGELALQADGKIVVGGFNGTRFGLLRINTDGTKDSSFGSNFDQSIATDFSTPTPNANYFVAGVRSVLIQADGKIVAGGSVSRQKSITDNSNSSTMFALARYAAVVSNNLPNGVWNGSVSTAFDNAQNWSNNLLPSDTVNILIPKAATRYPTLSTAASGRNLTVEEGATLTLAAAGTLTTMGSVTLNGLVVGEGLLRTRGTSVQRIAGGGASESRTATLDIGPAGAQLAGPLKITQRLILNGSLATNGQTLRLMSSGSTGTAMVVNNAPSAVVNGTVTVERSVSPLFNLGQGYRHYSSPVSNAKFSTLAYNGFVPVRNEAYNTAADPGTVSPFPNIFEYNEARVTAPNSFDQGWQVPADALEVGKGYTLNTYSFPGGASPITFVGTLNNGTISRTLTAGSQNESGWNFVGNPYPAPIDWNLVTIPTGMSGAAYVFRSTGDYTGSYVSYVNGVGPSNIIPAMQGFFVRATAPSVTLQFTNAARLTIYADPAFFRPAAESRPLLRLDVTAPGQSQPADAAYVYFQQGATALTDAQFDAYKLPGTGPAQLSTVAGADKLAINGLPLLTSQGSSVALTLSTSTAGTYTFSAGQLLNFDPATPVLLEDKATGTWQDLRQQPSYSFTTPTANTTLNSRFVLHFGQNRVLGSQKGLGAATVSLYPNPVTNGQLQIQVSGLPSAAQKVHVQLYNTLGQVVRQQAYTSQAGAVDGSLPTQDLSSGVYTLRLTNGQQVSTHQVVIR